MQKNLAHDKTKDELTEFLSHQILYSDVINKKRFVVSWREKKIHHMGRMCPVFEERRRRQIHRFNTCSIFKTERY